MKILFVRLKKETDFNPVPHLGLGILASILKAEDHDVKVLDYLLFINSETAPLLEDVINDFKPDLIGFSIYTATYKNSVNTIYNILHHKIPIIVGGPHPTLYGEDMKHIKGISYIVRGEAEEVISELVKTAVYKQQVEIIDGKKTDDAPAVNITHFKNFLKEYILRGINLKMVIDNVRADSVDEEFITLAKAAGNSNLCIGVESGNEEVFKEVNKGETLEKVKKAARLIKKGGLELGLCFVIGLPYDSLNRTWDSINLAKELAANFIFWNMVHPMDRTKVMDWFVENGATIYDTTNYSSYDTNSLRMREPVVETKDFSRYSRKRAYFIAVVETEQYSITPMELLFLFMGAFKYNYLWCVTKAFSRKVYRKLKKVYKKSIVRERA